MWVRTLATQQTALRHTEAMLFINNSQRQWNNKREQSRMLLQLMRETGMHSLEVLRTANLNSAKLLGEERLHLDQVILDQADDFPKLESGRPPHRVYGSHASLPVVRELHVDPEVGVWHTVKLIVEYLAAHPGTRDYRP